MHLVMLIGIIRSGSAWVHDTGFTITPGACTSAPTKSPTTPSPTAPTAEPTEQPPMSIECGSKLNATTSEPYQIQY